MMNYITTSEEFEKYTSELFKLMSEDKFITRIHETYPLKDVAKAHTVSKLLHYFGCCANVSRRI